MRVFMLMLAVATSVSAGQGEHPRVLMRAKAADGCPGLDEIRAKAKKDPWKSRIDGLSETTHGKALKWLITGDEAAAKACLADLQAMNPDDGYGLYAQGPVFELPVSYDWLRTWKGFTDKDRADVEAKITKTAEDSIAFLKGDGDSVWHTSAPRALMGVALAAAAMDGKKAEEWGAFAKEYFETVYAPAMAALDGGAVAGMSYAVAEGFAPLGHALWAMKTGLGYDGFAYVKAHGDWLAARLEYMAAESAPDMTWDRWGDCVAGSRGALKDEVRYAVDAMVRATGSKGGAWMSRRIAEKWPSSLGYHDAVVPDFFVFGAPVDPVAQPPSRFRLFGRDTIGQGVFRSGWDDDATVVAFKAGDYFDDHGHFDQGSFTIFRRGRLALDSGTYGKFDSEHRKEYSRKSIAHNTLVFGKDADGGQRIVKGQDFQDLADWKAKKKKRSLEGAEILAWETGEGWGFVSADLAPAYDPAVVRAFTRDLVWLDPGILVICDRVDSSVPARWLLHTTPEPKIDGSAFSIDLNGSRLWGKTVLPEKPSLKTVGPGCIVDGKDYPPDATSDIAAPGAWRVEVSGGTTFLHVLVAQDAKAALPAVKLLKGALGVSIGARTVTFKGEGASRKVEVK